MPCPMGGARSAARRLLVLPLLLGSLAAPPRGWAAEAGAGGTPWLRRVPAVAEAMQDLPAFLRDTDLRLQLRTFYFDRRTPDGSFNEAWTMGGRLAYASGWLLDTFQMGATVYGSLSLYAPGDRDGTLLLKPGQEGFVVPGVAYGALRHKEYALLTGYRQLVDQTYVNPQDSRMAPNTFEGATLKGKMAWAEYQAGYLTQMKQRNADRFISMTEAAGVKDHGGGLALAGVSLAPWEGFRLQASNQFGEDVFNTAFIQADYIYPFTPALRLSLSGQYTDQRAVGDKLLGGAKSRSWVTQVGGARVGLTYGDVTLTGAFSATGTGNSIQTPYGTYPGFLHLMEEDFNRAGEIAWLVGLAYDFSGLLLPGLSASFNFAQGTGAVDPMTRAAAPDQREYDLTVDYRAPQSGALSGFSFRLRAAALDQEDARKLGWQVRLILNYEIPLL